MISPALVAGPSDVFSRFEGESLGLLIAAFAMTAGWLAIFAVRWLATFPRLPDEGPTTTDLREESPAVVNLLTSRWKATRGGVAATLVDLAARRLLGIDLVGRGEYVVRLKDAPDEGLTVYERQVLELVRARATGGSAPLDALDLGEPSTADAWWKRFEEAVVDEARKRGLARDRWTKSDWVLLGGGLAVVFALFALAFAAAHIGDAPGDNEGDIAGSDWLMFAGFAWLVALVPLFKMRDLRDTAGGRLACAHWLGVRRAFEESGAFDDIPPPAVTIWERHLAYAVALGAAHETADALPMAAHDPETAWSRYSGRWRQVRVSYPERFGFGEAPFPVLMSGLGRLAVIGGIAFFALPIAVQVAGAVGRDLLEELFSGSSNRVAVIVYGSVALFFSVAAIVLIVNLVNGLVRTWRGLADLGRPRVLEGEVVKIHGGRIAVDDGTAREIVAWTPPAGAPSLGRGMVVRATLTPRLYYAQKIEVVSRLEHAEEPAATAPARGAGGVARGELSLADIRAITGLELNPFDAGEDGSAPAQLRYARGIRAFRDGGGIVVGVGRIEAAGLLGTLMWRALTSAPGIERERVAGVGDEAWWVQSEQIAARAGERVALVTVAGESLPGSERRRLAADLAVRVLGADT